MSTERWWEDDQTVAGPAPVAPVAVAPAADWGADDPVVEEPWQRIAREQPLELDPNLQFDGYQSLGGDAGFRRESDGVQTLPTVTVTAPRPERPLMERLGDIQQRHSRAFGRGASSLISGPLATLGDLIETTVQDPLRRVMTGLTPGDTRTAEAYADPLRAQATRDEALAAAQQAAAERQSDLEAIGGRPTIPEMATDPVLAVDYLGSMVAESLPAMGATVATGGLAGAPAGAAVMGGATGASQYADALSAGQSRPEAAAEAVLAAMAETAGELPGLTGLLNPGRRLAGVGLEAAGEAGTQLAQTNTQDQLRGTETPVLEQLRQALDAGLVGAGVSAPFAAAGAAADAANPPVAPPTPQEIGAEQVAQAIAAQQAGDVAAAGPQANPLAAAIQSVLAGVDTAAPAGVQDARPQSAGVPTGETRGQVQEVQQVENQQAAGGAAAGRAGQEEAVQAEVAQAVVQPLAPRVPPTPEVPSDLTLEQARAAYDLAQTDVERSTAAARIAAVQAREAAASAPAVPAAAQDAGQSSAVSQSGTQDGSGAGAIRTAEPVAPAAAADRDIGIASGSEAAAGVAPQLRNTGAVTDAYTDTADPDIQAALGTAARGITVHRSPADLRPEDRQRLRFTDEDMTSVEGVYDPDTGRVHIFEGNLDKSMPAPQRKAWVAAHERSGHAGIRGMFADVEGSNVAGRRALLTQLDRAQQNPTISAIAKAMQSQRPETGPIVFEEAIVEVAAAVRTGNYDHIKQRYGVDVPPAARAGIEGYIRRLIEQLKRAFGKAGEAFSDADLFKLIEDSHRYAARGEVRGTSARAETGPVAMRARPGTWRSYANRRNAENMAKVQEQRLEQYKKPNNALTKGQIEQLEREGKLPGPIDDEGPVAQRAFHGTPTKGISTFDLNKIGTGEGNQAFGWGMYFAGRREIADFYRRGLSAVGRTRGGTIADQLLQKHGDRRTALEVISRLRRGTLEQAERMLERRPGKSWPDKEALLKELDGAEAFIRSDSNRGQLYQQEVPEDNELLDWDAPLSQQPPAVRAALRKVRGGPLFRESMQDFEDSKGVSIYNSLASDFGSDQDASEVLREAGIPGLRYADGSSRLASDNKSYNYVIWDQQRIGEPEGLIASRTSSGILRNLTPAEQRKVTDKVAEKIEAHLSKMPSANEMAAVAAAGEPKRGWYRQSAEAISAVFGPDAPRFAGLLAAMSPQTSVESNLRNALNTWVNWDAAGRPQDREAIIDVMGESVEGSRGRASVLGAWINNSVRALTAEDPAAIMLSGPKVDSFMRNLLGNVEEVTNDAWMASYAAVEQKIFSGGLLASGKDPGKGSGYLAMNALVRDTARRLTKLTGETWTPAEVQETVWSWAKTLYELADSATEIRTARELVQDRAVTAELLQATPDFGTLFADPEYAGILEEAGYGEQIKQIRAGRDAARQAGQESGARRKAEPFAPEAQRRYEERAAARLDALRKQRLEAERVTDVTEAEEDIPFSRKRTVNVYGPDQGTDLAGLPMRVRVGDRGVVEFHGYAPAQQIAQKYAQRHGNAMPTTYAQVDEARAKRIADAYERMAHAPEDPEVKRAYRAMIDETLEQYRDVLKTGLEIEFITGDDPYTNGPRDAILDVVENNHLWVYPTRSGFGTKEDFDPANNPLLEETEFEISGQPALANDIFRAVHDYFGHIANGVGFRADGEENAWREHSAMYSPLARRAMTSETRGQNSWLNYGPHGEANRTAKTEDTVFADQKTGLMPAWVSEDGAGDEVVASRGFSAKARQPDAVSVDAYHYSPRAGLKALDTSFAGTVAAGRERRRFGMGRFGENGGTAARLGFYVREPGEPVPAPERVVSAAGATNVYRVQLDNLYDGINDPRNIIEDANGNVDLMEEEISDAGFDGFLAPAVPGIDVPTAIVFDIGKKKIPVEAVEEELVASRREREIDTPEFKRWFGDSKVVDENGEPLVMYHGSSRSFSSFRVPAYFVSSRAEAEDFSATKNPKVVNVYLAISNPVVIDDFYDFMNWTENTAKKWSDKGFDGAVLKPARPNEPTMYIAFRKNQIKSATSNSGAFDPAKDSIVASRVTPSQKRAARQQLLGHLSTQGFPGGQPIQIAAGTGPLAKIGDVADALRIKLQDKMLPVLRAQEATGARNKPGVTSLTLDDAQNAYRLETLMHGAVKDIIDGGDKRYLTPLQGRLKNLGMSVPTFEGYLLARAAAEVNAQVAKVNPGMPDGGSGLTTADAAGVLAGTTPNPYTGKAMTPRELQAAAQLATLVDGLRAETLQNMVDGGQITPKLAAELKRLYPHYVPMRGREVEEWMESAGPGTGRGLSGKRAPLKRRLGRGAGNLPQNILGEMAGDFQRSAVARAKAKVNQAFLRFALANPMPELFTVEPVDLEWKYSKATGEAYLGVRDAADDLDRSMLVMHDGDPVRIRFEDRDLRDAMLNMGPDDLRGVVHILGAINRWRSKVLTQFNPQFAPVNITRDAIFGMSALVAEHGVKIAAQAAAGYVQATRAMFRQSGDQRPGDSSVALAQRTWDDWARDASEVGMKTGLAQVDDVKDLQRQMSIGATTLMQLAAEGKPWPLAKEGVVRALRPVVNTISRVNEASENALRLSAYVALRKSGMSRDKAAEYAKNMTINFNRKGQWGSVLNAIYLFYNASIQGSHAVVRVLRNPKVAVALGALGALQGLLVRSMMDDDDDDGITDWDTIPDYVKRTSLIIPLGALTGDGKDYYALPMPYGFNVFTYTGGRVSQWMHLGARESDPSFVADVFKSLTESFSPIQINGDYGSLYGDQLGFAMQLAANRDDQGRPIAADNSFSDYDVPKALQGRATTPQIYERTAQLLAKLGGGNLQKRIPPVGYLDVAPEQLEAVTNYMGGGLLSMVNKSMRWAESWNADLLDRPMDAIAATPIASRFVNTGNEGRAIADRYYGDRGELARKTDVLQDQLSGKTDAEIPEIIAQAGAEDAALSGIEAARYKRGNKATGKAAGDIKRTAGGNVDLEFSATSSGKAMQNAEKKVKALGKQINTLRDEEITVQHVVDIGTGNGLTLEQIGLPVDYDGAAVAPRRIRTRTIRALQEARAEAERQTLRTIEFNKRNRGPAPGLRESSLPEGRRAEYIGIGQGGRATPAPDVLAGAKNAPKMVMVGDYSGMAPELRKRFDDGALGVFDPRTKTAYVVMGLEPAEAKITAYHEIAGHYGLQGALGNDYEPVLNRARQNPLVRELADKMHDMAYKGHGNRLELTEEALSELAAARRAGDYERIEERWGVNIPDSVKPGLSGILARVMQMTRRKLADLTGDEPEAYDDDQVYSLIEDAWKHVEDGP